MRKPNRARQVLLLAILALVIGGGIMLHVGQTLARERLPAHLSHLLTDALGRDVFVGKVAFGFPGVFTVKRIRVAGDPADPRPLLVAQKARASLSWWDLFVRGRVRVSAFHVDGAHLRTTIDLRKKLEPVPNLTTQLLSLTRFGVQEVGIHKSDADVTTILPSGERQMVAARGLDATARLRPESLNFRAGASRWTAGDLTALDLSFAGRGDPDRITLTNGSARFQGGTLTARGTYLTESGAVAMRVDARNLPLRNLASQIGLPPDWAVRGGLTGEMDVTVSSGELRRIVGTLNVARGEVAHGRNVLPWTSATAGIDWKPERVLLRNIDVRGEGLSLQANGDIAGSPSVPLERRPFVARGQLDASSQKAVARLAALLAFATPVQGEWSVERGNVRFNASGTVGDLQRARADGTFSAHGLTLKRDEKSPPLRIASVQGELSRFPSHLHVRRLIAKADGLTVRGGFTITPKRPGIRGVFGTEGEVQVTNLRALHQQDPRAPVWQWLGPAIPSAPGRITFHAKGPTAAPWNTRGSGTFSFHGVPANLPVGTNGRLMTVRVRSLTGSARYADNRLTLSSVKAGSDLLSARWDGAVGDVKRGRDVRGLLRLASGSWERIPLLREIAKAGVSGGTMLAEFRVDPALQAKQVTAGSLDLRGARYRTTVQGKPKTVQVQVAQAQFRIQGKRVQVPSYRVVTPQFVTSGRGYGLDQGRAQWSVHARGTLSTDDAEALARFWDGQPAFTGGRMTAGYTVEAPPGRSARAKLTGNVRLVDALPLFPPGSLPIPREQARILSLTGNFALAGNDVTFRNLDWRAPAFRATGDGSVRVGVLDGNFRVATPRWQVIAGELAKGLPVAGGTLVIAGRIQGRTDALKLARVDGTLTLENARLASDRNASVPIEGGELDLKARVRGPLSQLVTADVDGSFTLRDLTLPAYRKGLARARITLATGEFDRNGTVVTLRSLSAEGPFGRTNGEGVLRGVGTGKASHEFHLRSSGSALARALPALGSVPGKASGGAFTGSLSVNGTAAQPLARVEGQAEVRNAEWLPPRQQVPIEIRRMATHFVRTGDTAVIDNTELQLAGGEATLAGTVQGLNAPSTLRYALRLNWRLDEASKWAGRFLPLPGQFTGGLFTGSSNLAGSVKQPVATASGEFTLKDTGFTPLAKFLGGPVRPIHVTEARGLFERAGGRTKIEKLALNTSVGTATGTVVADDRAVGDLQFRGEISRLEPLLDLWPTFKDRVREGRGEMVLALHGPLRRPQEMRGTVDLSARDGSLTLANVPELYAVHPFTELSARLTLVGGGEVRIEKSTMRGPKANMDATGVVTADGRVHLEGKSWFTDKFTKKVFKPRFLYPLAKLFGFGKLKSGFEVDGTLQEGRLTMGITDSTIWKLGVRKEVPERLRKIAKGEVPLWSSPSAEKVAVTRSSGK